jgi:hypothetical protein
MTDIAEVVWERLTDGSKVWNVQLYASGGERGPLLATIGAEDEGHAKGIAHALNGASFVDEPARVLA